MRIHFSICKVITYDMNKKGADIPNQTYIVLKLIMLDTYCCELVLEGNNAAIVKITLVATIRLVLL